MSGLVCSVLDALGMKHYPQSPKIRSDFKVGVACHINRDRFLQVKSWGLGLVSVDVPFDMVQKQFGNAPDWSYFDTLFAYARTAGLEVATGVGGFPPDPLLTPDLRPAEDFYRAFFGRFRDSITYLTPWNEPDLLDFYRGTPAALEEWYAMVARVRDTIAPAVKIIGPNCSALSASDAMIRKLSALGVMRYCDLISQHVYEKTPDQTAAFMTERIALYRACGWEQPVLVTEMGFNVNNVSEEKQATYLVNALAQLSLDRNIVGAIIYMLGNYKDAASKFTDGYGVMDFDTGRLYPAVSRLAACLKAAA